MTDFNMRRLVLMSSQQIEKFDEGGKLKLVDGEGNILAGVHGGNRIFSIPDTEKIVELSAKIEAANEQGDATLAKKLEEKLGELMTALIDKQNKKSKSRK